MFFRIFHPRRSPGTRLEVKEKREKIERYMNLRSDIFECLNHGFLFPSSLVSGERYGRKILKKIPDVPSGET